MKLIPNIEPFNDIYYKDCFYNSVIPVVDHFNGCRYPIFSNDILYFQVPDNTDPTGLKIIYCDADTLDQVLDRAGLSVQTKDCCEQLIDDIAFSIREDRPVVIWVDSFYESIRKDTFQKLHWGHTLLIYGVDTVNRQCAIVEHQNRMNLNYRHYVVDFEDITGPYQGYMQYFYNGGFPSFFSFAKNDTGDKACMFLKQKEERERLLSHTCANKRLIQQGLDDLSRSVDASYGWYMAAGREEVAMWIESLNQIINGKSLEYYRGKMLAMKEEIIQLHEESLTLLKRLRSVVARDYYNNKKTYDGKVIHLLYDFLELEKQIFHGICVLSESVTIH